MYMLYKKKKFVKQTIILDWPVKKLKKRDIFHVDHNRLDLNHIKQQAHYDFKTSTILKGSN